MNSIPERRLPPGKRAVPKLEPAGARTAVTPSSSLTFPVWRCKVCGYLCARDKPPEVCPVCKAKQDRFERFM